MGDFIEYHTSLRARTEYLRIRSGFGGSYKYENGGIVRAMAQEIIETVKTPVHDRETVIQGLFGVLVDMDDIRQERSAA